MKGNMFYFAFTYSYAKPIMIMQYSKSMDILNKLKHCIPIQTKLFIYNPFNIITPKV